MVYSIITVIYLACLTKLRRDYVGVIYVMCSCPTRALESPPSNGRRKTPRLFGHCSDHSGLAGRVATPQDDSVTDAVTATLLVTALFPKFPDFSYVLAAVLFADYKILKGIIK